ncbi:MAG: hypothetical protein AB7O43_08420 [Hyphomicrobiaceae bacterium]
MKKIVLTTALVASLLATAVAASAQPIVSQHGFDGAKFWTDQQNRSN